MSISSGFMIEPWTRHSVKVAHGLLNTLWWRLMPGETIKVKWPVGEVRIKQEPSDIWDYVRSADPNDHYRPWMEENVGRQGWDWDWMLTDNDVADNLLTIKFRRGRHLYSTAALLKWG